MKKVTFTPKTDIEEYIQEGFSIKIINEFYESGKAGNYNLNIYEELTEGIGWENWQGLFDPLEFLNLFYEQLTIVEANKEKPISIIEHLLGLKLEKKQLRYLLYNLKNTISLYYFVVSSSEIDQLHICHRFIDKEYDKISLELDPKYTPDVMYEPKPQPEAKPIEINPVKYKPEQYVLAYLLECKAEGKKPPIGIKKELERIGNERMGAGKGNTFYKAFNKIANTDLDKEQNLIEIAGENWKSIILSLSKERHTIQTYIKTKYL